jgi:hypothetical protein
VQTCPRLEGHWIIKNVALASAGIVIGPPSAAVPLCYAARPRCERLLTLADIRVTSTGAREFEVVVGEAESTHRVTVPEDLVAELRLPEGDLEGVVRESFVFLLEREPASSIMPEFSLDVIPNYFPEFKEELPKRL